MSVPAGSLRFRATIERRATLSGQAGRTKGDFAPVPALTRISAGYREATLRSAELGNGKQSSIDAESMLREWSDTRTITSADRFILHTMAGDVGFEIVSVGATGAQDGVVRIQLKKIMG